jgi:hypothetical protein
MRCCRLRRALLWIAAAIAAPSLIQTANSQTVWSGLTKEFSKANFADATMPENQDRITDNVWLTRAVNRGIFNIRQEVVYDDSMFTSPADTEWATDINNPGETIAAANWGDLIFEPWIDAYGGPTSRSLPFELIGRDAVVHLISDNIYLDLRFTDWTQGGPGGFSYQRAEGDLPPPPTIPGDYNGDDVVDAADYVIWRKNLGQPVAMNGDGADGNENGTVDPDDYNVWRTNFGRVIQGPASGAGQSAAVPEPATSGMVLTAELLALGCWPRKQFKITNV